MPPPVVNGRNVAPNPKDFKSFEDAFAYPVPAVRRFETQLQSTVTETRSRLRSLVGDSYRELLGSADMIIDMHAENKRLDSAMDLIAQKCSARTVEKAMAARRTFAHRERQTKLPSRRLAADLALSQACIAASRNAQSTGRSPLLAAKLLILARLLLQSATASTAAVSGPRLVDEKTRTMPAQYPPAILDTLWRRHRKQNQSLLASIDDTIRDLDLSDKSHLLDALAAYSLVTTSTTTDVLRHYLYVRQSVLSDALASISVSESDTEQRPPGRPIVDCIATLIQTIRQAQTLFPRRLSDALVRHKDSPVIQDPALRSAVDADLDLCELWISDNVRVYSHWIRSDDLSSSHVSEQLQTWATTILTSISAGLDTSLSQNEEVSDIVQLRKGVITQWLQCPANLPGVDIAECVSKAREMFTRKLTSTIETKASSIEVLLKQHISSTAQQERPQNVSLWEASMHGMGISNGAAMFRRQIDVRRQGKDSSVQELSHKLDAWRIELAKLERMVRTMRETRWNDVIDLESPADEDDAAKFIPQLSRQDPEVLMTCLKKEQKAATQASIKLLEDAISADGNSSNKGAQVVYLLRLTREVLSHLKPLDTNEPSSPSNNFQGLQTLYAQIAEHITGQVTSNFESPKRLSGQNVLACELITELWAGEPLLPQHPSPSCLRFAYQVQKAMQAHGSDVWTASAVDAVKEALAARVQGDVKSLLDDVSRDMPDNVAKSEPTADTMDAVPETNGGPDTDADKQKTIDPTAEANTAVPTGTEAPTHQSIQALYDTIYLSTLLRQSPKTTSTQPKKWEEIINQAISKSGFSDEQMNAEGEVRARIDKSVAEYHRRTYLLFGLLSPPV